MPVFAVMTSFTTSFLQRCHLQRGSNIHHVDNKSTPRIWEFLPPKHTNHLLTQPSWTLKKKSLNFIFPTKYVIPKSFKFSHWLSESNYMRFFWLHGQGVFYVFIYISIKHINGTVHQRSPDKVSLDRAFFDTQVFVRGP